MRDRRVFIKTLEGLQPVDVIVRRLDDSFCDPLELRPESTLGVPGLIDAVRNGKVEKDAEGAVVSACELALEGLCAMKKLARTEEHGDISYGRAIPERPSRKHNFDDWTGGRLN